MLDQINTRTIGGLAGAWTSEKFDTVGAGRAMPVVRDGVLFITAGSRIYAYNAKTGATLWSHQTDAAPATASLNEYNRSVRGLPNREGVAVGEGLVFVGLTNSRVIALGERRAKCLGRVILTAAAPAKAFGAPATKRLRLVGTAATRVSRRSSLRCAATQVLGMFALPVGRPGYKTGEHDS